MLDCLDIISKVSMGGAILVLICLGGLFIGMMYDDFYIKPIASDKANTYCRELGFDQYKSFSRIGLWSENPVGIRCEYAEKYTDLGVRTNS